MNTTDNSVFVTNVTNVTTDAPTPPRGGPPPIGYYGDTRIMMWKVIPPIIISIGTIGNILTKIVLIRQIKRLSSTAMFLLTLAVSDTVILWCGPFRNWYNEMWEIDIRILSDVSCKLQLYLTYVSIHMSSWLLVAVTMERVLSVVLPHRVKLLCTTTKAGIVIVVITVLVFAVDVIIPVSQALDGYQKNFDCTPTTKKYLDFRDNYFMWIDFCVAFACPFVILLFGNILIIVRLAKSHSNRVKMNATRGQTKGKSPREGRSITLLLVSLCFVFFITMSPVSIYQVWYPYRFEEILAMTDPYAQWDAYQYFLFQHAVVNIVGYTNASTNFLLYVFSGSKFRGELKALFCCKAARSDGVFGSRSRLSSSANTHSSNLKSYSNASKLSPEQGTDKSRIYAVSEKVSDATQLDKYVNKENGGQGHVITTANDSQGYFNNAFNADDGTNQMNVSDTRNDIKEQTGVALEGGGQTKEYTDVVTDNDPDNVALST